MHMHHNTKIQIPVLRAPSAHSSSTQYQYMMLYEIQGDEVTSSDLRDAIREVIRGDYDLGSLLVTVKLHQVRPACPLQPV